MFASVLLGPDRTPLMKLFYRNTETLRDLFTFGIYTEMSWVRRFYRQFYVRVWDCLNKWNRNNLINTIGFVRCHSSILIFYVCNNYSSGWMNETRMNTVMITTHRLSHKTCKRFHCSMFHCAYIIICGLVWKTRSSPGCNHWFKIKFFPTC